MWPMDWSVSQQKEGYFMVPLVNYNTYYVREQKY